MPLVADPNSPLMLAAQKIREFKTLKEEMSMLSDRQSSTKKEILVYVDMLGEEDDRGHKVLQIGDLKATNQKRVSNNLDMEIAEIILSANGLKDSCIKMVPVLDEEAIMAAYYAGKLTESQVDAMFPPKVTYALIV